MATANQIPVYLPRRFDDVQCQVTGNYPNTLPSFSERHKLSLLLRSPVYQLVNVNEPTADWRGSLMLGWSC